MVTLILDRDPKYNKEEFVFSEILIPGATQRDLVTSVSTYWYPICSQTGRLQVLFSTQLPYVRKHLV